MRYILVVFGSALLELAGQWAAGRLGLERAANAGVAFGLLSGLPGLAVLVSGTAFVVLAWAVLRLNKLGGKIRCALAVMAGGAAANLVLRLWLGAVPDWIPLPFSEFFFPGGLHFNLADVEIALGAVGVLLSAFQNVPVQEREYL